MPLVSRSASAVAGFQLDLGLVFSLSLYHIMHEVLNVGKINN
jgi:hypothetical protein